MDKNTINLEIFLCIFAEINFSEKMETVIIRVKNERDRQKLVNYSINNGWQTQSFNNLLNRFIDTAPRDVPITDDEIIAEIKKVRQNGTSVKSYF